LGLDSVEIHCRSYIVCRLHCFLKIPFEAFLQMARDVLRFKTLHIEHGVVGGVVVVVEVDGDLAWVLLAVPVGSVVLVLTHDFHFQLCCAFLF